MCTHYCNTERFRKKRDIHGRQLGFGLRGAILLALAITIAAIALSVLHARKSEEDAGGLNRSIAVMGAASIIDTLRAERTAAIDGAFNLSPEAAPDGTHPTASLKLVAWRDQLVRLLGEGASGGVECKGPTCIVTVRWIDRQKQEEIVQHLETEVRL